MDSADATKAAGTSRLARATFLVLAATLAASVALRVLLVESGAPDAASTTARGLVNAAATRSESAPSFLAGALPVVTEACLFGLIGFALGFTTRKALKLALVLVALAFVAIQVLTAMGKIDVDWGGVVQAIDRWILNLRFDSTLPEFLKQRLPTLAVFVLGYVVGLRKG